MSELEQPKWDHFLRASLSTFTSSVHLFVIYYVDRVDGESTPVDALYDLFSRVSESWWGKQACGKESFRSQISTLLSVKRNRVCDATVDPNRTIAAARVPDVGVCLLPLMCPIKLTDLAPCPSEWGVRPQPIQLERVGEHVIA
jgi:hypothetical protein